MVWKWSGILGVFLLFTVFCNTVFANDTHLLLTTSKTFNIKRPETELLKRQIALREEALAPKMPEKAVRRFLQGVKSRNGALQFAVFLLCPLQLNVEKVNVSPEGGKSEFLRSVRADLFLSGQENELSLYVDLSKEGAAVRWRLLVDGEEKIALTQPEPGLYTAPADIKIEDLDGDQKPEVLVYRFNSGSAGAKGLTVYSPAKNWTPLFAIDNPFATASFEATDRYQVAYAGNHQVDFRDRATGLSARLPLDMKNYESIDAEEREKWLRAISTWIDPVSDYLLYDSNGDGIKEIITVQRIIGISHPDTIGLLKDTYEITNGVYIMTKQAVYDSQDHLQQEVLIKK